MFFISSRNEQWRKYHAFERVKKVRSYDLREKERSEESLINGQKQKRLGCEVSAASFSVFNIHGINLE